MNSRLHAVVLGHIGAAFAALVRSQGLAATSTALYRNQSIQSGGTIAGAAADDFAVCERDVMLA